MGERHSKTFDFDRVLGNAPDTAAIVEATKAAVAAGDLVRRGRARAGMSQTTLAKRVGTTQPHISDIERGLGSNGPSVGTLSRLLLELDDELLVQSRKEQALWMAGRIDAAETAVGDLTERLALGGVTDLTQIMAALAKANTAEQTNPFKNTLLNGLILGIYLAIRAQPEALIGAGDMATMSQIIAGITRSGFSALVDKERRAPRRIVSAPKGNKDAN